MRCRARAATSPTCARATTKSAAHLRAAFAALPPMQRDAFLLQQESGLSLPEIATLTGVGVETVKSRLRYAVAKLRSRIGSRFGKRHHDERRSRASRSRARRVARRSIRPRRRRAHVDAAILAAAHRAVDSGRASGTRATAGVALVDAARSRGGDRRRRRRCPAAGADDRRRTAADGHATCRRGATRGAAHDAPQLPDASDKGRGRNAVDARTAIAARAEASRLPRHRRKRPRPNPSWSATGAPRPAPEDRKARTRPPPRDKRQGRAKQARSARRPRRRRTEQAQRRCRRIARRAGRPRRSGALSADAADAFDARRTPPTNGSRGFARCATAAMSRRRRARSRDFARRSSDADARLPADLREWANSTR